MFWFGYCSVMRCLISSCVKESCLGQGTRQLIKWLIPGRNTDDKFVQLLTLTNYCFYDYEQNIEEIRTATFSVVTRNNKKCCTTANRTRFSRRSVFWWREMLHDVLTLAAWLKRWRNWISSSILFDLHFCLSTLSLTVTCSGLKHVIFCTLFWSRELEISVILKSVWCFSIKV